MVRFENVRTPATASVQITSYDSHLGFLRSEHCYGEHRTVYSGRCEADHGEERTISSFVVFVVNVSGGAQRFRNREIDIA
jgi:hypothetical protein